jgi:phosphatidylethanolamine-binding protein (PEBP) family uncharacterized protein
MAPLEIRHRSVRPISAKHAQASRFLQQSRLGGHGWYGMKPPAGHGVHHYHFQLFALNRALPFDAGASVDELVQAMKGCTIASGELVGTYEIKEGR